MNQFAIDRRTLLKTLALAPFLGVGVPRSVRAEAANAGLISSDVCMLATEVTEGPYYFDPALLRADITEGKAGLPLVLRLQVVKADCTPIVGARVDVWHCDADGNYSGYDNKSGDLAVDARGMTFLRGTQATDATGVASFATIYPGWYRGRTTHIHYKVFLDQKTLLTSQIFFDEDANNKVYGTASPYAARAETRDVLNATDGIAQQAGDGAYAKLNLNGGAATADLVVGVSEDVQSGGFWNRLFG